MVYIPRHQNSPIFGKHLFVKKGNSYLHAIGVENNKIITIVPISSIFQPFLAKFHRISFERFANIGKVSILKSESKFEVDEVRDRANRLLGTEDTYTYNNNGDNFAHLCLNGEFPKPDGDLFGRHLSVNRGPIKHHGVGLEYRRVAHINIQHRKVHIVSFDEFSKGNEVQIIYHNKQRFDLLQTRNRAMSLIGNPGYNLLSNNCEHLARWCATGKSESKQVQTALLMSVLIFVAGVLQA